MFHSGLDWIIPSKIISICKKQNKEHPKYTQAQKRERSYKKFLEKWGHKRLFCEKHKTIVSRIVFLENGFFTHRKSERGEISFPFFGTAKISELSLICLPWSARSSIIYIMSQPYKYMHPFVLYIMISYDDISSCLQFWYQSLQEITKLIFGWVMESNK